MVSLIRCICTHNRLLFCLTIIGMKVKISTRIIAGIDEAGIITFIGISFILYAYGIEVFEAVWSFPSKRSVPIMVLALVGTGVYTTIKLGFPQLRYLKHGISVTAGKYDDPGDEGDLNHFKALTTALSATVGIGNIAGVATALYYGGPGAIFWMWITAFFGTTLKYAECTLSMKYREMDALGYTTGGPMYTISSGLGKKWHWMAVLFAAFAIICSFATGNAIQAFTVSDQIYSEVVQIVGSEHFLTTKRLIINEFSISLQQIMNGIFLSIVVGFVIIGGIKRIGNVTSFLAPFMAFVYVSTSIIILFLNLDNVGNSFFLIVEMAFNPPAQLAGTGGGILMTMLWGIKRGLYSNEAGQGSAAIAHSTAKTKYPVREGTVAMLGPYIDTIIICTLTGLVIISTGAWHHTEFYKNFIDPYFGGKLYNSSLLTSYAFKIGLDPIFKFGDKIVTISVLLFAISTAISWSYYGDRSTEFLFGGKAVKVYRWIFVLFVFLGAVSSLEAVWAFGDAALGIMTFPNLISIVLLGGVLKSMSNEYFKNAIK